MTYDTYRADFNAERSRIGQRSRGVPEPPVAACSDGLEHRWTDGELERACTRCGRRVLLRAGCWVWA